MKKSLALILAVVMVLGLALTGCGSSSTAMTVCVGPYPDTIDPALNSAVDGATYVIHAFAGLVGYEQAEDGTLELVADCAKELPEGVALEDGKVSYTYELKDDLKWSDGTALTAEDFVYAWNRAIAPETAADYAYMFDVIDGYEEGKLNITASEDGKSLTVVLKNDVPYFNELCAFPTYMPVQKAVVDGNESWATKADTYVGNGPYKVTEFSQSQLVMEKNENYHNADAIKTDKIVFPFNEDDSSLLANFKNGSYLFIDSVPNDQIKTIEAEYPEEYQVVRQLGTYYVSYNMNDEVLKDFTEEERVSIRKALSLMLERNYIVEEIGLAKQQPANAFVPPELFDADGKTEFVATNGVNRDGAGYFSVAEEDYTANCDEALKLLEDVAKSSGKFTVKDGKVEGFPKITFITNEGTNHEQLATYMQGAYSKYGITLQIEKQEWNTFLDTRKAGDYSLARNGWVSDYNDPISFLDMWITESGNNDCQFGKGEHAKYAGYSYNGKDGLTWAESYDAMVKDIKASTDMEERFELMHQAEDLLMSTGAICPIYYYTDPYMCSEKIDGFFASPLGYKYFMYATVVE